MLRTIGTLATMAIGVGLLALGLLAGAGEAQAKDDRAPSKTRKDYAALATGPAITSSQGVSYALVPSARATVAEDRGEATPQAMARKGLTDRSVLERKGRFIIYRDGSPKPAVIDATHPVLLNERSGNLAVATGMLRVKVEDMGQVGDIAARAGLGVAHQFPHLGVATLAVPEGKDLLAALAALRSDARVGEADLELIERVPTPR